MAGHSFRQTIEAFPLMPDTGAANSSPGRSRSLRLLVLLLSVFAFNNMLRLQRSMLFEQNNTIEESETLQSHTEPKESQASIKAGSKSQIVDIEVKNMRPIARAPSQRLRLGSLLNGSELKVATSMGVSSSTASSQAVGELALISNNSEPMKNMTSAFDSTENATINAPAMSSPISFRTNGKEPQRPTKINIQHAARPSNSNTNMTSQFVIGLWNASQQQPQESRGIVLPLFDKIASLGMSLILELRAMSILRFRTAAI